MLNTLKKVTRENKWVMIALGVAAGCLGMWLIVKVTQPVIRAACVRLLEDDEEKAMSREGRQVSIEAITVKMGNISKRISAVGKLRANASVTIRAEMHGKIKSIDFIEGASVKKGDSLIRFEDADAQAEYKQADAELILRKADFERISKLHDQKIESVKKMDESRAAFGMAEGKLEAAKSRLDKTTIQAPFHGTMGLIDVSVGAYVQAAQDLVTIVDSTPIKVDFKVPEKNLHDIGVGQTAEIRIDAFKDQVFHATVEAVDARVQEESHSIPVRASINNENGLLRPGLFASVSLIIGEKGDTILIPESAVDREGEIEFIWVVEKGKAMRRRILTGTRENGQIEIVANLREGQVVVTAGQLKLSDGVRVKIANMQPADPANPQDPSATPANADAAKSEDIVKKTESSEVKPEDKSKKDEPHSAPSDVHPESDKKAEAPKAEEPKKAEDASKSTIAPSSESDKKIEEPKKIEDASKAATPSHEPEKTA